MAHKTSTVKTAVVKTYSDQWQADKKGKFSKCNCGILFAASPVSPGSRKGAVLPGGSERGEDPRGCLDTRVATHPRPTPASPG